MSSIHSSASFHPQIPPELRVRPGTLDHAGAPARGDIIQAAPGHSLRGRQIRVGDGMARSQTLSSGQKAWGVFKTAMKPFAFAVGVPVAGSLLVALGVTVLAVKSINFLGRMANQKIFEPRAERKYREANAALVEKLETARSDSVLNNPAVKKKLSAHALAMGGRVTKSEVFQMVAMGENIAAALQQGDGTLPLFFDGFPVTSNTYTTRALTWYMMATAANQDVDRKTAGLFTETSDMVTAGSILLKDPGRAIYNFMNSAPTACSRMSTHFAERVAHSIKHKTLGFIPTGKPRQRGIEDYAGKMPGEGGAILFDQLKDDVLFVKIESGGCPPYFQHETGQGAMAPLAGICRFFHALDRNVDHSMSFVHTRLSGPDMNQIVRQEHLHKGVLKATVDKEFNSLVQNAIAAGIIKDDAKAIGKSAHRFGLPYVYAAIDQIRAAAAELGAPGGDETLAARCVDLMTQCDGVLATTHLEAARAGPDRGIERKAFETHIAFPNFGPGVEGIAYETPPPPEGSYDAAMASDAISAATSQIAGARLNARSTTIASIAQAARRIDAYIKLDQRDYQLEAEIVRFKNLVHEEVQALHDKVRAQSSWLNKLQPHELTELRGALHLLNMHAQRNRVNALLKVRD